MGVKQAMFQRWLLTIFLLAILETIFTVVNPEYVSNAASVWWGFFCGSGWMVWRCYEYLPGQVQ